MFWIRPNTANLNSSLTVFSIALMFLKNSELGRSKLDKHSDAVNWREMPIPLMDEWRLTSATVLCLILNTI